MDIRILVICLTAALAFLLVFDLLLIGLRLWARKIKHSSLFMNDWLGFLFMVIRPLLVQTSLQGD